MKIIIAVIIFSLIILFHELGHFLLAKKNGVCVTEYSLGLGPTLFGKQIGETKYSLKLLPFGGACMMLGEDEESGDARAFFNKSVWARMSIILAGPVFNFLLAFLLSLMIIGSIGYDEPVISGVLEGYSAAEAGMMEGDRIVKINGERILVYRQVSMYTSLHSDRQITVTYERDGKRQEAVLDARQDPQSGRELFGFLGPEGRKKGGVFDTIKYSVYEVGFWMDTTVKSLAMLVRGNVSPNDISGPVGIVNVIGDAYEESISAGFFVVWLNLLNIAILITANVGVMNLLPLPALDGGRMVFLILEALRGKRVSQDKEGMVHFVGLVLLMILMVFVMFNDIRKIM